MKVVLTGSSGMVGQGVLLECLESEKVKKILVLNRKPTTLKNPKLKEIIVNNFFELDSIKSELSGYDTCFFCIGVSALGKNEEEYTNLTYNLTLNFAGTFLEYNPESIFCYVSGQGTDSSEKGRAMWARVKGKTENALLDMSFKSAYMFRPGYIQPLKGIKSRTNWYSILYTIFKPIYFILKHFPGSATNTVNLGKAMINAVDKNADINILENRNINELAGE